MRRKTTVGDLNRLQCPACRHYGLNDLWESAHQMVGIEGTIETSCSACGAECVVEVTCSVTALARVKKANP